MSQCKSEGALVNRKIVYGWRQHRTVRRLNKSSRPAATSYGAPAKRKLPAGGNIVRRASETKAPGRRKHRTERQRNESSRPAETSYGAPAKQKRPAGGNIPRRAGETKAPGRRKKNPAGRGFFRETIVRQKRGFKPPGRPLVNLRTRT